MTLRVPRGVAASSIEINDDKLGVSLDGKIIATGAFAQCGVSDETDAQVVDV